MIDVKLRHVSQDKFGFRSRILSIKLKKTINTPIRVITNYEINKKRKLPTQIYLDNDIVLHAESVFSPDFLSNRRNIADKINRFEALYGDLAKIHELIIPCIWPKRELLDNVNFDRELLNVIVAMFAESDANYDYRVVGIPPLYGTSLPEYKQVLKEITKKLDRYDISILPIFSLEYRFEKLVEYTTEELGANLIGFKYGPIKSYIPQYLFMRNYYADKDIAFISVNTDRYAYLGVKDFAVMHLLPFVGSDLYASKIGPFRGGSSSLPKFRVLDRQNLQLPLIRTLENNQRDKIFKEFLELVNVGDIELEKIVKIVSDRDKFEATLKRITQLLKSSQRYNIKQAREILERINSLTRVQEIVASSKELYELQQYIKQDETDLYTGNRSNLRKAGQRINMSTIARWQS